MKMCVNLLDLLGMHCIVSVWFFIAIFLFLQINEAAFLFLVSKGMCIYPYHEMCEGESWSPVIVSTFT